MKNPFERMSAGNIRILYTVFAVAVLVVSTISFLDNMVFRVTSNDQCAWLPVNQHGRGLLIQSVLDGGVTDMAGVKNGDTLLAINGRYFKNPNEAQRILDSLNPGDHATYLLQRGTTELQASIEILKLFNIQYLSVFLLGFGFLIVGYVVVMTKPQGKVQRMFGRYGALALLVFALIALNLDPTRDPGWKRSLLGISFFVGRIFAPPVFVSFFFYFPVRKLSLNRKWLVPSLYVASTAIPVLLALNNRLNLPNGVLQTLALSPLIFFVAGLIVFAHSYYRLVAPERRKQLRHILISVGVGVLVLVYLTVLLAINPFIIYLVPVLVSPALLLAFVPAAFGYAIFRYRVMDIELILKRSLIYGAVTTALAAIYLLFVFGVGSLLSILLGHSENRILSIGAFIVIAFVFDPIKRRVQESIDRTFYRERHNYQKALLEFSQELPRQMNLDQILQSMVNRISGTMHVEKVAVVLCDEKEGCSCVTKDIPEEYCQFVQEQGGLISVLRETKVPQSFVLLAVEPDSIHIDDSDKEKILKSGVVLAIPMFMKERLIGSINVGPKLSGKIYSQEDIDLLSTVAGQAAIALENARLHKSEVEKQRMEEELKLAWKIQQGLLPKSNPEIPGLDIAGVTIPARTVGGDYFDYIQLGPKRLLVVVADVSGKGMSAALYMSKVQGMVQLAAHIYTSPRDILVNVNRRIFDGIERKSFITMILAMFDLEKNDVRICRAGHNKALIGANGVLEYLSGAGIGLGLERGELFESTLEEVRKPLRSDGLFMFYTDGLTEAMNEQENQLGEEAVSDLVKANGSLSASDLERSIVAAADTFRGTAEQHDDITLVIVKCK